MYSYEYNSIVLIQKKVSIYKAKYSDIMEKQRRVGREWQCVRLRIGCPIGHMGSSPIPATHTNTRFSKGTYTPLLIKIFRCILNQCFPLIISFNCNPAFFSRGHTIQSHMWPNIVVKYLITC
jgi:hypothetical protein